MDTTDHMFNCTKRNTEMTVDDLKQTDDIEKWKEITEVVKSNMDDRIKKDE